MLRRLALAATLPLVLAGCAALASDGPAVSAELVRVAGEVLGTARTADDARSVLHRELGARPGARVLLVAGHRFLLAPATVDRLGTRPPERAGWLVAQSLELVEQGCLRFQAAPDLGWQAVEAGNGRLTLSASATGVQFVSVGIELHHGCVVALHMEQAGSLSRPVP